MKLKPPILLALFCCARKKAQGERGKQEGEEKKGNRAKNG